jgi:hypothetical protein
MDDAAVSLADPLGQVGFPLEEQQPEIVTGELAEDGAADDPASDDHDIKGGRKRFGLGGNRRLGGHGGREYYQNNRVIARSLATKQSRSGKRDPFASPGMTKIRMVRRKPRRADPGLRGQVLTFNRFDPA